MTGRRRGAPRHDKTIAGLLSTFAARVGGAETLVAKDDLRHPALVVAAAGDSTGDEPTEWLWRGLTMWAAQRTDLTAEGYYGYGESGPYTGPTSIQTSSDGYWSTYYNDTFSRVGEVYGSTPNSGTTYGGAAGGWTADGSAAVATGTGNSAVQETTAGGTGGKRKASLSVVLDTTPGANDKVISLFLGQNTSNRVQFRVSVSTVGTQAWIINKIVGGSSTTIATGSGSPLTTNAINQFDMSIELDGSTGVTARVGASTVSGTLDSGDVAAVVDAAYRIYFQTTNSASAGTKVDRAWAEKWVAAAARTLTFYNGSRAGSIASYAIDRLANLYPVAPDVLFISYGINYGSGGSVAAFETALDALCLAFRTAHPTAGIVICSQNPLFDPVSSGSITAHQARNAALRRYAAKNGYGYLPVGEMYAAQADGGASWIQSDGAHPKTASDAADPNNGAYQAAILLRDYLNGLSLRD